MNKKLLLSLVVVSAFAMTACGGGSKPEDREDVTDVEVPAVLACETGESEYKVTGTPIEFCYNPAWGEVVVEPQTVEKGSATKITFAGGQGPELWYQSADFEGGVCFTCLNVQAPEEQLTADVATQFPDVAPEALKVRKTDIFGVRAARVNDGTTVTYFVPNAFEGHHMSISSPQEAAADLDDFVYGMIL